MNGVPQMQVLILSARSQWVVVVIVLYFRCSIHNRDARLREQKSVRISQVFEFFEVLYIFKLTLCDLRYSDR